MRKLVGFYTDEHGKVRPITAKTGKRRVKVKLVRSAHAVNVDRALKAPVAKSAEQWYKQPNRYDLPGVDTPEDKAESLNMGKANSKSEGEKMKVKIVTHKGKTGIVEYDPATDKYYIDGKWMRLPRGWKRI